MKYRIVEIGPRDAYYGDKEYIGKVVEGDPGPVIGLPGFFGGYFSFEDQSFRSTSACFAAVKLEPVEERVRYKVIDIHELDDFHKNSDQLIGTYVEIGGKLIDGGGRQNGYVGSNDCIFVNPKGEFKWKGGDGGWCIFAFKLEPVQDYQPIELPTAEPDEQELAKQVLAEYYRQLYLQREAANAVPHAVD